MRKSYCNGSELREIMTQEQIVYVPDLGGVANAEVIEILVAPGDQIEKEASLLTLESDKASMEIPSPYAGEVVSLSVKVGDKVSEGTPILTLKIKAGESTEAAPSKAPETPKGEEPPVPQKSDVAPKVQESVKPSADGIFAGPSVRRLARELEIDLSQLKGTGPKARITREDLLQLVKGRLKGGSAVFETQEAVIDFSQFGPVDEQPLNKIKKLTATQMRRAWLTIPHVTQFDEVDITELEAFRKKEAASVPDQSYKLTLLAFIVKAAAKVLSQFPQFNASLSANGESLIYKKYCHIGIAVDTPQGLVVPVVKNADALSVGDIAKEMQRLSALAREKKIKPIEMQGGCFTISSLGGIGGGHFTPIINSPEVAILGVSRAVTKPVYVEGALVPRLMLPLALSYDHRVIDGAEGARFMRELHILLNDVCRILL